MTGIRRTYNYMRERERLTNNMHTLFPLFVAIILSSTCFEQTSSWFQTFAVFWMLYAFFRVIPRRLNFICRRFGTLCLFHLHRRTGVKDTYPPMKMGQSVPKRRHIKFRRRGITQKKAYNKQAHHQKVTSVIIIIIIIYLSRNCATFWPVPASRIHKSLQR